MSEVADRRAEVARWLESVRRRIHTAALAAGREAGEVRLVVVTKTFPPSDVRLLASLGVRDVAENRHQEARAKVRACAELDLRWHFVGQLQTNKARSVAGYSDVVHSVDRHRLVGPLAAGAQAAGRRLGCLVQVSLDPADAEGRGGIAPEGVPDIAAAVAAAADLELRGVMAVAPPGADPAPAFSRLAAVAAALRVEHPQAGWVSAGMSEDFETAIRHGATHVRLGSAILGNRPPLR